MNLLTCRPALAITLTSLLVAVGCSKPKLNDLRTPDEAAAIDVASQIYEGTVVATQSGPVEEHFGYPDTVPITVKMRVDNVVKGSFPVGSNVTFTYTAEADEPQPTAGQDPKLFWLRDGGVARCYFMVEPLEYVLVYSSPLDGPGSQPPIIEKN